MNLKKYLQQQAEKDAENLLTESDKQFCMQLAEEMEENSVIQVSKKPKIKIWASVASAIAAAVVAAIVIPVTLNRNHVDEVYYKEENTKRRVCQIDELNADLNYFRIEQQDNIELDIILYYDEVSTHNLYYGLNITTVISKFELYIVTNNKYDFHFDLGGELINEQLNDYIIKYENIETDELSIIEAKYKGVVESDKETVYIDYGQSIDLGKQAFFDDIQSVLKVKN